MTKNELKQVIKDNADNTAYFDGSISLAEMKNMLMYRMGFGGAETNVILASLQLAGAKFKVEE